MMDSFRAQLDYEVSQLIIVKTETIQDHSELQLWLQEYEDPLNRTLPLGDELELNGDETMPLPSSSTGHNGTSSHDLTNEQLIYQINTLKATLVMAKSPTPLCGSVTRRASAKRPRTESNPPNVAEKRQAIDIEPCLDAYLKKMRKMKNNFRANFGLSKAQVEKFLMDLSKSGTEGGPSDEELEFAMNKTVQLRRFEILGKKTPMSISTAMTLFPCLKHYRYLAKEFEQLRGKEGIKWKIDNVFTRYLQIEMPNFNISTASFLYSKDHGQSGVRDYINCVGAFSFANARTANFPNSNLFAVRSPDKPLEVPRVTPFIDIVDDGSKEKLDPDYPMDVYVEGNKILTAKNFYEAFTSCYYYYWIFHLAYTGSDSEVFSDFDQVIFGSSQLE